MPGSNDKKTESAYDKMPAFHNQADIYKQYDVAEVDEQLEADKDAIFEYKYDELPNYMRKDEPAQVARQEEEYGEEAYDRLPNELRGKKSKENALNQCLSEEALDLEKKYEKISAAETRPISRGNDYAHFSTSQSPAASASDVTAAHENTQQIKAQQEQEQKPEVTHDNQTTHRM